jgi:hypothetical protein
MQLHLLKPEEITSESLKNIDVIMTGIRAYNTVPTLQSKQQVLFDFVKKWKTMIVQYNTPDNSLTKDILTL